MFFSLPGFFLDYVATKLLDMVPPTGCIPLNDRYGFVAG